MKKIIIIGGGAAGMMAAITAAREGADVTILEHKDRVGKKILATGNGRCNFTNTLQEPSCYRGQNPAFAWDALKHFPAEETIQFFLELGIYAKDRNGYLYPNSDQASSILDVLRLELSRLKVDIITEAKVLAVHASIKQGRPHFQVKTAAGNYQADAVILAAGSKASPVTGSDGSGYDLAKKLGHRIVPVLPALVQLYCNEKFYKALAGVRVQGTVSIYANNQFLAKDTGEIQLAAYGISGIPVFQVSRYAAYALHEKKQVHALLDFMPELTADEFRRFCVKRISLHPERSLDEFFIGLLNKKLAQVLIQEMNISPKKSVGTLSKQEVQRLVRIVKEFRTEITKTNSYEQAQICAGGISTKEISSDTMESKIVPGLYFAGEIVDVDGICGGYNLQWAWSSGHIAGTSAARERRHS